MSLQFSKKFVDLPAELMLLNHLTAALACLDNCRYFNEQEYANLESLKDKIEETHALAVVLNKDYREKSGLPEETKE